MVKSSSTLVGGTVPGTVVPVKIDAKKLSFSEHNCKFEKMRERYNVHSSVRIVPPNAMNMYFPSLN